MDDRETVIEKCMLKFHAMREAVEMVLVMLENRKHVKNPAGLLLTHFESLQVELMRKKPTFWWQCVPGTEHDIIPTVYKVYTDEHPNGWIAPTPLRVNNVLTYNKS